MIEHENQIRTFIREGRALVRSGQIKAGYFKLERASILLFRARLRIDERTLTDLCCQAMRGRQVHS